MISHHPSAEILVDYARGSLKAGAMLVVAVHVGGCALCRAEIALWKSVGGVLLEEEEPASLSPDAFEKILGRLRSSGPVGQKNPANAAPRFLKPFPIPEPLRGQAFGRRIWLAPNIWFATVAMGPTTLTYLLHAGPNTKLPLHSHVGREFTAVLHGSFRDDTGLYGPGDFADADHKITHTPGVTGESDCLCLLSADGPMKLFGTIAKAIQALTGRSY